MPSLMKKIALLSTCFIVALILLTLGLIRWPRISAIAMGLLVIAFVVVFMRLIKNATLHARAQSASTEIISDKHRVQAIRAAKVAIVVLMLALLNGLRTIQEHYLPTLVGVVVNLLLTFTLIRFVIQQSKLRSR